MAIGVSPRLDHACKTHYLLNYDNVTVSESWNVAEDTPVKGPRHFVTV